MPFPIDYKGQVELNLALRRPVEERKADFLIKTQQALMDLKANDVHLDRDRVVFRGGILRAVFRNNLLNPITRGCIEVLDRDNKLVISYSLNFRWLFIVAVMFILIGRFFTSWGEVSHVGTILIPIFMGIFFYAANMGITLVRFRKFVESIISD